MGAGAGRSRRAQASADPRLRVGKVMRFQPPGELREGDKRRAVIGDACKIISLDEQDKNGIVECTVLFHHDGKDDWYRADSTELVDIPIITSLAPSDWPKRVEF